MCGSMERRLIVGFNIFLSDQVGHGGPRVLSAVAIFTLLKCGSASRWDSITCHTLTPSPALMNKHAHTQGTILTPWPIPKGLIIESKDAESRNTVTNEGLDDSSSFC